MQSAKYKTLILTSLLLATAAPVLAEDLDFGQAVIRVPDMHESEPYVWRVKKNPAGYRAEIKNLPEGRFLLTISPAPARADTTDLYLTDKRLRNFSHPVLTRRDDGGYLFNAALKAGEKYLAEIVFKDESGFVNLSHEFKAGAAGQMKDDNEALLTGYELLIKQFPDKVYSLHSVTFVFEVQKDGRPLEDLEPLDPIDGALVRVAAWRQGSWFSSAGDFIQADSKGNETGREAAVSLVFSETGPHRIFAEFRHQGKTRWVSKEIPQVWPEPDSNRDKTIGQ